MINLSTLKNFSHAKKYSRGSLIARENMGTEMYLVLKGEVGVYANYRKSGEAKLSALGPGDFFCETALFIDKAAPYTTVALADSILLPVNKAIAATFIREEPEAVFDLIKTLCARLDAAGLTVLKQDAGQKAENGPAPAKAPSPSPVPAPAHAHAQHSPTTQATPPPAAPAAPAQASMPGAGTGLFPEGHGSYTLELNSGDRNYLMERGYTCPICKKEFKTLAIRSSKLVEESTDADMRHRYKGIEPLYYDVIVCPHCLYSTLAESFNKPDILKADLSALEAYRGKFAFGVQPDEASVFAGYYLALLCAPRCFGGHRLATAKLLLKLSRVYQDCGDKQMEEVTSRQALEAYLYIYLNEQSDATQDQQLSIIIGELYLKLGDIKNARDYFFKAKVNRYGVPLLKNQAENRLLHIKDSEAKAE